MPDFSRDEIISYLKPNKRISKHTRGDVTVFYDRDLAGYTAPQAELLTPSLVSTKEFLEKLDDMEVRPGEKIYIAWSVIHQLTFHLAFERDKLLANREAGTAAIKTENVRLYAFAFPYQEEVLLDSRLAEFIVFRKHLRSLPPALYRAATGLRSF